MRYLYFNYYALNFNHFIFYADDCISKIIFPKMATRPF